MQAGSTPTIHDYYTDLVTPDVADMQLELEQLVQQGVITPEQAQAQLAERSEMNNISTDPKLKQAQMAALSGLQEISDGGGMTASDRAMLSQIKNEENAAARGQREAILQNAQARGMGGSGLELMSQMQNQQASATRNAQRDMDVAGLAQQRALDALIQGGQLGGQIQAQDFNQQAQIAQANDAISKFNAQNKQQTNLANVAANNAAQATNLQNKQAVADANVNNRNMQQQYNKDLIQKNFDNEIKKRGGQVNTATQNAANAGQDSRGRAQAQNQTWGTMFQAAAMMSDERAKDEIEDFDAADFLDKLTGYKYSYKDKKHGEGKHAGVMAQDLEKSEIGSKLVTDTPEGKVVDYGKAGPAMMASLAALNKRLKKIEGEG